MNIKIGEIKLNLVLLFIGLCPMFYIADRLNPDFNYWQGRFFMYIAGLMIAVTHCNRWIGAFVLMCLVYPLVTDVPSADWGLIYVLAGAVIYDKIVRHYDGDYGYLIVVALVMVANVFMAVLQAFKQDILLFQNFEAAGFFMLPSYMGQYSAIVAPLIACIHPILAIFPTTGVIMSKSMFSAAALIFGVFYIAIMLVSKKHMWIVMVLSFVVGCSGLFFLAQKDSEQGPWGRRMMVWKMVASQAFRSPFLGHGFNSYKKTLFVEFRGKESHYFAVKIKPENEEPFKREILRIARLEGVDTERIENIHFKYSGAVFKHAKAIMDDLRGKGLHGYIWDHPHNEYLKLFYEFGLLGLFILGGFLWNIAWKMVYCIRTDVVIALSAGACAVLILAIAHFPMHLPKIASIVIVVFAILERNLNKAERRIYFKFK